MLSRYILSYVAQWKRYNCRQWVKWFSVATWTNKKLYGSTIDGAHIADFSVSYKICSVTANLATVNMVMTIEFFCYEPMCVYTYLHFPSMIPQNSFSHIWPLNSRPNKQRHRIYNGPESCGTGCAANELLVWDLYLALVIIVWDSDVAWSRSSYVA